MKRKAYELSVSGQYDGLFKLTDQQRPGEGDVSVLRVRIPPQFEMSGDLSIDVQENRTGTQVLSDGGTGLAYTPTDPDQGVSTTGAHQWTTNSWSSEVDAGTTYQRHPTYMLTGSLEDGWSTVHTSTPQTLNVPISLGDDARGRPDLSYVHLLDFRTEPTVDNGSAQDYSLTNPSRATGSYPDGFNLAQAEKLEINSDSFDNSDPYSLHLRFNFVSLTQASSGEVYLLRTTNNNSAYPEVDVKLNNSSTRMQLEVIFESDPSVTNPIPTLTLPYEILSGRWYNLIISFVDDGANYRADVYLDAAQEERIMVQHSVNFAASDPLPVIDEVLIGEGYEVKVTHFSFIDDSFSYYTDADKFTYTLFDGDLTSESDALTVYGDPWAQWVSPPPSLTMPGTYILTGLTYNPPLVNTLPEYELFGANGGTYGTIYTQTGIYGGALTAQTGTSTFYTLGAVADFQRYPVYGLFKTSIVTQSNPLVFVYTPAIKEVLTRVRYWDSRNRFTPAQEPRNIDVYGVDSNGTATLLAAFDKGATIPSNNTFLYVVESNIYADITFSNTTPYASYELHFYGIYGGQDPATLQTKCEIGELRLRGYVYEQPTTMTVSGVSGSQVVQLGSLTDTSYAPSSSSQTLFNFTNFNPNLQKFDSYVIDMSGNTIPYKLGKFTVQGLPSLYPGLNADGTLSDYYWADVTLGTGEHVDAVTLWPHRTDYDLFPQDVQVWGKVGAGASTKATSSDVFVPTSAEAGWTLVGSTTASPSNPGGAGPTGNNKVATIDLPSNNYTNLRIRVNKGGLNGGTTVNYFRIGEVQLDYHTDFEVDFQTRLPQPIVSGWFQQGARIKLHDHVNFVYDTVSSQYKTVAHGGTVTASTLAYNSLDARAEILHLFLDAFTNRTSPLDTITNISLASHVVEGTPSFVMEVGGPTYDGRIDVYVDYTPHGGRLKTLRLVSGTYAVGHYSVTHRTAFIALEPGTYQLNTTYTVGVNRLAVVDHYERPTLTFEAAGGSAYGLATLDMNGFDGTVTCNTLLNRRLGFPDAPLVLQHGKVQGITSLNDVKRISMYLEPSIQYHVSSHVNNQSDMAQDTLTVISFSITGDDLTDSAIYALTSDFDVNSAKMTSNKSSAIQFKIYKEVYDSVSREFRVEPIRMGPNDYAEVKLVVTHAGPYVEG